MNIFMSLIQAISSSRTNLCWLEGLGVDLTHCRRGDSIPILVAKGNLHCLKWMQKMGITRADLDPIPFWCLNKVILESNIGVLHWLQAMGFSRTDEYIHSEQQLLLAAARSGSVEALDWLLGMGTSLKNSYSGLLQIALYNNNMEVLEWLWKNKGLDHLDSAKKTLLFVSSMSRGNFDFASRTEISGETSSCVFQ